MTTPTVVQCLIPLLLALPILFGEEDFAAWETGAGRKLLEFSELAAHHAKTVWGACIAGGAALFGFLARHGSLAAHDVDIIRKDPDLLAICLLVVEGSVGIWLLRRAGMATAAPTPPAPR